MKQPLPGASRPFLPADVAICFNHLARPFFLSFIYLFCFHLAQAQVVSSDDAAEADRLARIYKDDNVICRSSHHTFTFDKGINALKDKVVVVQEDAELQFLSLKKFAGLTYPEFYNKFIRLKTFQRAIKYGNKF